MQPHDAPAANVHDSRTTGPLAGTGVGRTTRKADDGAGFHPATRPNYAAVWPRGFAFGIGKLDDGSYRIPLPRRIVLARLAFKRWPSWDAKKLRRLRALYWWLIRNYETEICDRCGGRVGVVFHVPDAVWEAVTGLARFADGQAAGGCLCPECVDDLWNASPRTYLRWTCSTTDEALVG